MDSINREEALKKLQKAQECGDAEVAHINADEVLCELLTVLGYADIVEAWDIVKKWYV